MSDRSCLTIVLAAGEGTRMKSAVPKVLHEVAGLAMVGHVVRAAAAAGSGDVAVVVGRGAEEVKAAVKPFAATADTFVQTERLGTAHAVLAAREAIARGYDDILILFGDTPLVDPASLQAARDRLGQGAAVVVMGFRTDMPAGYGRLIEKDGQLVAIREEKDCSDEERTIRFCNGGLMAVDGRIALDLLDRVGNANAKGEYYLTDIVALAREAGREVVASEVPYESVLGINTRVELAEAESIWQRRRRHEMMLAGVTLLAPETVHFAYDTEIGPDSMIEPNVFFGPGVTLGSRVVVHAFSHLAGVHAEQGALIGPFARLRPGTELGQNAKVGNFCEVKKAQVGDGAKINHLTYIGDAVIGAKANIGAGTITCNYDGFLKHVTEIGSEAFIGSNSSLVAPVRIGDGAYVGSGSVVTQDVPDGALAIARGRQTTFEGRGTALRARLKAEKARKSGK